MSSPEQPVGKVIKAKKLKDGFTFQLSVDHIIEQTLLKEYNSPNFLKTTIRIEDTQSDGESESSDCHESAKMTTNTRHKGVPIKLQLKRQYAAEDSPSPDSDSSSQSSIKKHNSDEPLDMTTKKFRKPAVVPSESLDCNAITPIPPTWIMRGLSREDHKKFQSAVSNASLSPYQRRNKHADSLISKSTGGCLGTSYASALVATSTPHSKTRIYCGNKATPRPEAEKKHHDRHLIYVLPDSKNYHPTQNRCILLNNKHHTSVKFKDLVGTVAENKG